MKQWITRLLLVGLVASLAFGNVASAQDPSVGSKEDNACNTGGALEGKCDSAWAWVCGWYLARLQSGNFTRFQVIDSCASLLPALPVAIVEGSSPCVPIPNPSPVAILTESVPTAMSLVPDICDPTLPYLSLTLSSSVNAVIGSINLPSGVFSIMCISSGGGGFWEIIFDFTDSDGFLHTTQLTGTCIP